MTGEAPYEPRPIDSDAELADRLRPWIEPLAANAHEIWARARVEEGWTHGPAKNAREQKTPFLVPYSTLTEAEKEVDRTMVRGTLGAALALGCVIELPPRRPTDAEQRAIEAWEKHLEDALAAIRANADDRRAWDFDLDDAPEIESPAIAELPKLRAALRAFQDRILPAWRAADARATALSRSHRSVARWAIWPGIAAILLGAVRAILRDRGAVDSVLCAAEFLVATTAAVAVARGFVLNTRDRWLTARQTAERLRVLKFHALADEDLWEDFEAWRGRWSAEVDRLARLDPEEAGAWVSSGAAEPSLHEPTSVHIPTAELAALSAYYLAKRQEYQRQYFALRAEQHRDAIWMLRLKLPIWLFVASVVCVLLHVIPELFERFAAHDAARESLAGEPTWTASTVLVLAAVLPVIGFGLRAWFSAFELPRRAHLFESKAKQLKDAIERMRADRFHPRKTLTHIELGEHFFENEHREWCRLILEAEWFV
jgi:hypothetical protein